MDKHLLSEDGVTIPELDHPRKRKRTHHPPESSSDGRLWIEDREVKSKESERRWSEVKKYLDPNPQLRGWDKGKYADKVKSFIHKCHACFICI